MKKALIISLVVCSLLVVPMASVIGADQELLVEDDAGDVIDMYTGYPVTRKNIDIAEVSCERDGKKVELKLKLVDDGKIQNSEDVIYTLALLTSLNQYEGYYTAGECFVYDNEYNELSGVDYSGMGTQTLTILFELLSSDEECQILEATTLEMDIVGDKYYSDSAPNEEESLTVDAGGPYEVAAGEVVNFSGFAYGGVLPYTWEWDLDGDGNIDSTEKNPTYTYEEAGEYNVTLTVTDDEGTTITVYSIVTITESEEGEDGDDGGTDDGTDDTSGDGDKDDSSDGGLLLFGAIIAIIAIIGIIAIIVIIRR